MVARRVAVSDRTGTRGLPPESFRAVANNRPAVSVGAAVRTSPRGSLARLQCNFELLGTIHVLVKAGLDLQQTRPARFTNWILREKDIRSHLADRELGISGGQELTSRLPRLLKGG